MTATSIVLPANVRMSSMEVKRVKGDERDFRAVKSSKDVGSDETRDLTHRRKQLIEQEPLVVVRVLRFRPASPQSSDRHVDSLARLHLRRRPGNASRRNRAR